MIEKDYNDKPDPKEPFRRVSREDHPDRCQATGGPGGGQCNFYKTENGPYCIKHGGTIIEKSHQKHELEQYRLQKYKARIKDFSTNPKVLSLRDEIGITRMLLETKLNRWEDADLLIANSAAILANIQAIHKIVMDCKKLESQMGMLMDRAAIQKLCDGILGIMSQFLTEDQMAQAANLVMGQIAAVTTARIEVDDA